jgi:hypothetical protein
MRRLEIDRAEAMRLVHEFTVVDMNIDDACSTFVLGDPEGTVVLFWPGSDFGPDSWEVGL